MIGEKPAFRDFLRRDVMDLTIRLGLITFLVYLCVVILSPFIGLISWALILAVALFSTSALITVFQDAVRRTIREPIGLFGKER
jgi:hypothetical protein